MPTKKTTKKKSIINRVVAAIIPPDRGASWEGAAKIFTAVGIFLVPIIVAPWSSDAWEIHKLAVLLIAVLGGWVCLMVAMIRRGHERWSWHPIDVLVLLFGLVAVVSTLTSVNWWTSLFGVPGWTSHSLLATLVFIGLYFLITRVMSGPTDRRFVWTILLLSLAVSLTAQVFQFANLSFLPAPLNAGRWMSTIGNLNLHITTVAAIFGAAMLVLWTKSSEKWMRWLLSAGVLLSWLVLLFSGRSLGWTLFAFGMVVVVLHQSREERKIDLRLVIAAVVVAALGMIAQVTNVASHSGLPSLQELTLSQGTTIETTLTALQHRPVLGTGPATWYDAFNKYRPESFNQSAVWDLRFTQGGGAWAQLFTTLGIVGGVLFLGLLGLGLMMCWRGWRASGDPFLLITVFVLAVTLITGFFSIWSFPLLAMAWISLGLSRTAVTEWTKIKSSPVPAWGYSFMALGAVAAIVLIIPFTGVYISDVLTHHALTQASNGKSATVVAQTLKTAVAFDSRNNDAVKLLANAYGRQIQDLVQAKKTSQASTVLTSLNTLISQATTRTPNDPQLYETDNQILNALSSVIPNAASQAMVNFQTLQRIEPMNAIHDVGYGQTVMAGVSQTTSGATPTDAQIKTAADTAIAAYNQALKKKPGYFQALLSKMQTLVQIKQYDSALAIFGDVSQLSGLQQAYVGAVRSSAYDGLNRPLDAAQALLTAITAYPNEASLYVQAATEYVKGNRPDEARSVLTRGQKVFPNNTPISDKLKSIGT